MKRTFLKLAAVAACTVVLAGCASGVKYQQMAESMPTLKPGEGRIYFFRSSSMAGAALQPEIRLNGVVVGSSKPGGFFFVDRAAGNYVASTATETERTASIALAAGETKYLQTWTSPGIMIGRVHFDIVPAEKALAELPSLSYTGDASTKAATK